MKTLKKIGLIVALLLAGSQAEAMQFAYGLYKKMFQYDQKNTEKKEKHTKKKYSDNKNKKNKTNHKPFSETKQPKKKNFKPTKGSYYYWGKFKPITHRLLSFSPGETVTEFSQAMKYILKNDNFQYKTSLKQLHKKLKPLSSQTFFHVKGNKWGVFQGWVDKQKDVVAYYYHQLAPKQLIKIANRWPNNISRRQINCLAVNSEKTHTELFLIENKKHKPVTEKHKKAYFETVIKKIEANEMVVIDNRFNGEQFQKIKKAIEKNNK